MADARSLQIFFLDYRAESQVISAWRDITGVEIESMDTPVADSDGFVQFVEYAEGFAQGALFSWPSTVTVSVTEAELAEKLAERLSTVVLVESVAKLGTWLVASKDLPPMETKVKYLENGIQLDDDR